MPVLTPITDCDKDTYADIARAKRGPRRRRLTNAWPTIEGRYNQYIASTAALEALTPSPLSRVRKSDCKHCYEKDTKPLGRLVARLLRLFPTHGLPSCQYCLIGDVESVDHYAPASIFPEFSVLPRNLVPACSRCNTLKNQRWVDGGIRELFSLYYEDMPAARYLDVDINFIQGGGARISFRITKPAGMTANMFRRIERHYEILELIERYNSTAIRAVTNALRSARILSPSGRATAVGFLNQFASGWEHELGANYWEAIVYRELASNTDFLVLAGI